jgi:hypothetical protein
MHSGRRGPGPPRGSEPATYGTPPPPKTSRRRIVYNEEAKMPYRHWFTTLTVNGEKKRRSGPFHSRKKA